MAEIHPFRGTRYNQARLADLWRVICPPYDIISPRQQEELYARHEYNFVRLELGRELPQDRVGENRYTRAASTLRRWLAEGVLITEDTPAIYLHDHHFQMDGRQHCRRSFFARVRLEEWGAGIVRPHEGTLPGPRRDRLDLLWALEANTSPILAMYEDPKGWISELLRAEAGRSPLISIEDDDQRHELWRITHPEVIASIAATLADRPLYIADGHHRYTSALTYRRERRTYSSPPPSGEQPYDFTLMSLVDMADPGLVILAPHRLVRGIARPLLEQLIPKLESFFNLETVPATEDAWPHVDTLAARQTRVCLACYGPGGDNILVLTLRPETNVTPLMPSFHAPLFRELDVSIADHVILEKLLGIDPGGDEDRVHYTHERDEAIRRVRDGEYQLAFFLRPISPALVKAVADAGEKMPRKSTYFYPKTPVGLVFYRFS